MSQSQFIKPPGHHKSLIRRAVLFPGRYVWFVFVSALDLMMTRVVLHFGGQEVNALADYILDRWELKGMVIFKFLLVALVVCICEATGRLRYRTGRGLATFAVIITCVPVVLAFIQLIKLTYGEPDPLPPPM